MEPAGFSISSLLLLAAGSSEGAVPRVVSTPSSSGVVLNSLNLTVGWWLWLRCWVIQYDPRGGGGGGGRYRSRLLPLECPAAAAAAAASPSSLGPCPLSATDPSFDSSLVLSRSPTLFTAWLVCCWCSLWMSWSQWITFWVTALNDHSILRSSFIGAVQLLRNAFLTNFDPPPPLSQSVTLVRPPPPPPRNVTLVCRPGLKPVMLKKEYITTSKILMIY